MFFPWFISNDAYAMSLCFFPDLLYKCICSGYSFELHRQVNAIQMGTHNICLSKEVDKIYTGCNQKMYYERSWLCTYRGMCCNQVEYGTCNDFQIQNLPRVSRHQRLWHRCTDWSGPSLPAYTTRTLIMMSATFLLRILRVTLRRHTY